MTDILMLKRSVHTCFPMIDADYAYVRSTTKGYMKKRQNGKNASSILQSKDEAAWSNKLQSYGEFKAFEDPS